MLQNLKLHQIIRQNGWTSLDFDSSENRTPFEILKDFLSQMEKEEIDFCLVLLSDYLIIREYRSKAAEALKLLRSKYGHGEYSFCSVQDFENPDKIKSSHTLIYTLEAVAAEFSDLIVKPYITPLNSQFQNTVEKKFFVDDFIGTGSQFLQMIKHLNKKNINTGCKNVFVFVIQEDGLVELQKHGFEVIYLFLRPKALASLSLQPGTWYKKAYPMTERIAKKMPMDGILALGYEESEATVTMSRTPDNTLRMFSSEGDNNSWKAPLAR